MVVDNDPVASTGDNCTDSGGFDDSDRVNDKDSDRVNDKDSDDNSAYVGAG